MLGVSGTQNLIPLLSRENGTGRGIKYYVPETRLQNAVFSCFSGGMGKLGQESVGEAAPRLIELLKRAYADEWFAHYNYFLASTRISGSYSDSVARLLVRKSRRNFEHAARLGTRIQQLGGEVVERLLALADHATDKPFKLPNEAWSIEPVLRAVLDAERTSIRTYSELHAAAREVDPVTDRLVVALLNEAVAGEEQIERLLADDEPDMSGG